MKKIFTLISVAFMAISANAQEQYLAIDSDGNIASEFTNATQDATGNLIVTIQGEHMTFRGVSSAQPTDIESDDPNLSWTDKTWPAENWGNAEWKAFNKNQKIWHWKDGVKTDSQDDQVTDFTFRAICGTGNPVTGFVSEPVITDGNFAGKYRAKYDDYYFDPATSTAAPARGEYFEFTSDADGMLKIGFGIASGDKRYVYLVEKATVRTFAPSEYKVEGYVQGCDNIDGTPMWIPSIKVNDDYTIGDSEFNQSYKDGALTSVDQVPKVKFAWIVFDVKAGNTYMLFTPTSQIAFRDYTFKVNETVANYTADDKGPAAPGVVTSIKNLKVNNEVNSNRYNLTGQKVDKNYKGLTIQNGKKRIQ